MSPAVWIGLFLLSVFLATAVLHPRSFYCVFYGVIYFFWIPSTFIMLPVFAVCNLDDLNWGTRENKSKTSRTPHENSTDPSNIPGHWTTPPDPLREGFSCSIGRCFECVCCRSAPNSADTESYRNIQMDLLQRQNREIMERLDHISATVVQPQSSAKVFELLDQNNSDALEQLLPSESQVRLESDQKEILDMEVPRMSLRTNYGRPERSHNVEDVAGLTRARIPNSRSFPETLAEFVALPSGAQNGGRAPLHPTQSLQQNEALLRPLVPLGRTDETAAYAQKFGKPNDGEPRVRMDSRAIPAVSVAAVRFHLLKGAA